MSKFKYLENCSSYKYSEELSEIAYQLKRVADNLIKKSTTKINE